MNLKDNVQRQHGSNSPNPKEVVILWLKKHIDFPLIK